MVTLADLAAGGGILLSLVAAIWEWRGERRTSLFLGVMVTIVICALVLVMEPVASTSTRTVDTAIGVYLAATAFGVGMIALLIRRRRATS